MVREGRGFRAPAFTMSFGRAFLLSPWRGLRFIPLKRCAGPRVVRPWPLPPCVGHTTESTFATPPVLGAPASIRVGVTQPTRLRPFALAHPKHLKPLLASLVVLARIVLLRRVCGLLFFLYSLQTFDLLEGEAHDAAVLALVLEVDCLLVVVDEDLRRHPAAVVEPLRPLRDVFVLYLLGLLAHPFAPCLASVSLPRRGSIYSSERGLETVSDVE